MTSFARAALAVMPGVVLAAALAGCASTNEKTTKLDQTVRAYVQAIRWGDFSTAAAMIRTREGKLPRTVDPRRLEDEIRVTHYEYGVGARDPNSEQAIMSAKFRYYYLDTGRVREVNQHAVWWFDPESRIWYLDDGLPDFSRR